MFDQAINVLKDIFNFVQLKLINILIFLLTFFRENTSGFFNFLFEKNILVTAIGFIVSTQITRLISSFIEIFVDPIVKRLSAGTVDSLKDWEITVFDVTLKIGLFLNTLFNFIVVFLFVYFMYVFSKNKDLSGVINWLRNTEEAVKETKTKVVIAVNAGQL